MRSLFSIFFTDEALKELSRAIRAALDEDGPDLTSNAVFSAKERMNAVIVAKEESVLAGLPLVPIIMTQTARKQPGKWTFHPVAEEGARLFPGDVIARIEGSARVLLRAERIILNFMTHMSGIATLTRRYADALEGTGVKLLDTRKTLPGLRYPEKYAVLVGGGRNHRKNLAEILMLKDNHIDAAGGIIPAVEKLRAAYNPCPPIEVECRSLPEVLEAVGAGVSRIMLDNMEPEIMAKALAIIPDVIEVEVSGGVNLDNIAASVRLPGPRQPDFISVGRLTHSAPAVDFSMRFEQ